MWVYYVLWGLGPQQCLEETSDATVVAQPYYV